MDHRWFEILHILFVVAWMGTVFYLPRILVNLAEARGEPAVEQRLQLMGRRLYRFGHVMFGLLLLFGLTLWMHFGISGGWLHAKLLLVALLFAYFIASGVMLKRAAAGRGLMGATALRWFNEVPVLLLLGVLYFVVMKPF
jgi:protoporphyrinogen IX oxidase